MIRPVTPDDAPQIAALYNDYIVNTTITFEEEPVSAADIESRIADYTSSYPWLVYEEDGVLRGYCYATRWRVRSAYRHSAETTVYVRRDDHGKGIGSALYSRLINEMSAGGTHVLVAGIALPNDKSVRLHERLGFAKVAHFSEIGRKHERWLDVGYWELKLRSSGYSV